MSKRDGIILSDPYRLVVGGVGIVYGGKSMLEARRRFRLFVIYSQIAGTGYFGKPVTLFKDYGIMLEYHPSDALAC
jgi:hypothetical protein